TCGRVLPLHRFSKPALSTTQPPLRAPSAAGPCWPAGWFEVLLASAFEGSAEKANARRAVLDEHDATGPPGLPAAVVVMSHKCSEKPRARKSLRDPKNAVAVGKKQAVSLCPSLRAGIVVRP